MLTDFRKTGGPPPFIYIIGYIKEDGLLLIS